jgi:hypothetical protein
MTTQLATPLGNNATATSRTQLSLGDFGCLRCEECQLFPSRSPARPSGEQVIAASTRFPLAARGIAMNYLRTAILLAALTALLMGLG